jgi:C1A family cysteine protease
VTTPACRRLKIKEGFDQFDYKRLRAAKKYKFVLLVQCGSCWAFAAMTPLEFSQCKANGKLVDLR